MEKEVNESEPISGDSPTEDYSVESLYKRFPNPLQHYKVAVYVKYQLNCLQPDYLRNLKSDYDEMLSRYENWEFVDYYVDTAPQSASLSDLESWIRLVSDCESGKVDLILIGNAFAFDIGELYLCVRFLASLQPPVGVFFEEQNLFSLAPDSLFLTHDSVEFESNLVLQNRRKKT